MLNLVQSYIDVACGNGEPVSYALGILNGDLGTRYNMNRLYEWRSGARSIPQPVQDLMLRTVIAHAIRAEGGDPPFDDEALDRLAARLCPAYAADKTGSVTT